MKESNSLQNLLVRPDGEVEADIPVLSKDFSNLCVFLIPFAWSSSWISLKLHLALGFYFWGSTTFSFRHNKCIGSSFFCLIETRKVIHLSFENVYRMTTLSTWLHWSLNPCADFIRCYYTSAPSDSTLPLCSLKHVTPTVAKEKNPCFPLPCRHCRGACKAIWVIPLFFKHKAFQHGTVMISPITEHPLPSDRHWGSISTTTTLAALLCYTRAKQKGHSGNFLATSGWETAATCKTGFNFPCSLIRVLMALH